MYIFIHIPKCGGTTFNSILRESLGSDNIIHFGKPDETAWFRKTPAEELASYKAIGGHIFATNFLAKGFVDPTLICLIRDPIDRFYSLYNDCRSRESHPLKNKAQNGPEAFLDSLIEDPVSAVNIHQCSYLCGSNSFADAWDLLADRRVFIADLTQFNSFYAYLSASENWKPIVWDKKNVKGSKINDHYPRCGKLSSRLFTLFSEDFRLREAVLKLKEFRV